MAFLDTFSGFFFHLDKHFVRRERFFKLLKLFLHYFVLSDEFLRFY